MTFVPRAANIDAYSIPITPAPTTTIDDGTLSMPRIWSESTIVSPSNSTELGRAGRVPTAMMILSALTFSRLSRPLSTSSTCGSTNRPVPGISATRLRDSWLRMTSISCAITCWVRVVRSATVISSFSR